MYVSISQRRALRALSAFLALTLALAAPAARAQIPPIPEPVVQARAAFQAGDYAAALPVLRAWALKGDTTAWNILGVAHDDGLGVPRDPAEAFRLWTRAAEAGNPVAALNLGQMLREGRPGIAVDAPEARRWLRVSAEAGYGPAQASYGFVLDRGIGGPVEAEAAHAYFARGQEMEDPWAFEHMAHQYLDGRGVAEDPVRARDLFAAAHERGNVQAGNNLGWMFEQGLGGPADRARAEALYREAVEGGNALAQYNLISVLFAERRPGDLAEAAELCARALNGPRPELATPGRRATCLSVDKALAEEG